ncbi:MAG: LysR family transcriptional regulator [Pseudomonadota bacterium]
MDWDKLRIFHAAADAGSFTHAGETLQLSQSAISRQVSALERDLGATLFHRHARGLVLTEQGELLYKAASEVLNQLQTVETMLADTTSKPTGELRVTAPMGLGTVWITQRLREFFELYPDIRTELLLADEQLDIAMRAADVAIWAVAPTQSDLIRRPLFTMHMHAFASAQYIRRFGTPRSAADLDKHRLISFSSPQGHLARVNSLETLGRSPESPRLPALRANSLVAIKYAIRAGVGIGIIPDYLTEEETDLVPILRDLELPNLPIYFVYAEEMRGSKRLQVFRDFLVAKAKQWKY